MYSLAFSGSPLSLCRYRSLSIANKPQVRVRVTFTSSIVMSGIYVCIQIIKCCVYMIFMALVFNVLLHCPKMYCLYDDGNVAHDQPTTTPTKKKKKRKPKHFDTIPNEPLIILIGR